MSPKQFVILSLIAGSGASACATASAPLRAQRAPVEEIQGPFIARGTVFTVRVSSGSNAVAGRAAAPFEAYLTEALRTASGNVIAPAGATLRGDLVWSARRGRWTLADATVRTGVGPIAVRAAIRSSAIQNADGDDDSTPVRGDGPDRHADVSVLARAAAAMPISPTSPVPREEFARDSEVQLVLTRPLLGPGAWISSSR